MKKKLAILCMSSVLLLGGGVTAMADSIGNPHQPADSADNMGEYYARNKAIELAWNSLSKSQKDYYVAHPAPSVLFPFGIDTHTKQPKGYPSCLASNKPAKYAPVLPLPKYCKCALIPN